MKAEALIDAAREQAANMRLNGHYSLGALVDDLADALIAALAKGGA